MVCFLWGEKRGRRETQLINEDTQCLQVFNTCLWDGLGTELPAEDRENWDAFTSGQLADTNKRNAVDLVSRYINYIIHLKSEFPFLNA